VIHHPPYRSLYIGGAGIAYTFWKAACLLDDPEWLHHARFWIDHVAAAPEDNPSAPHPENAGRVTEYAISDSFFLGNRGVAFVQALVAHAEDNPTSLKRATRGLTAPEGKRLEVQELFQGISGRLLACALLEAEIGDDSFREHGDSLATDLIETANFSVGSVPWRSNHALGLAHGRAGNYYALLHWSKETGYSLPDWILPSLRQYAQLGQRRAHGMSWPVDDRNESRHMNTWCNGAPGLVFLWTQAYSLFGDDLFLETARAAAEYALHEPDHRIAGLCCGAAGMTYALLALNRADPKRPWLDHAHHYCDLAVEGAADIHARLSLYRGSAGVACLLLDMLEPDEAMMPALEG
jgi:hypothetical protein